MDTPLCKAGHQKVRRSYGWHCPPCQVANAHARYLREVAEGKRGPRTPRGTSASTPTDSKCNKGHARVRRPNGELACPTCQNAWKRARRAAERRRECLHATQFGFEGIISETGKMVCLACLVAEANAA